VRDNEIELLKRQLDEFKVVAKVGAAEEQTGAVRASVGNAAILEQLAGGWSGSRSKAASVSQQRGRCASKPLLLIEHKSALETY
jgi:hypothetical protein